MTTSVGITLSDEIVEAVNAALLSGKAITVSYVDADGRPHLSLRGSTQVHSPDQLAIWVRKAEGGIASAIATNPAVALLYRNADTRTTYIFNGRARVADDEETRRTVFDKAPKPERDHDPDRNGVAVLIDLDEVSGGTVGVGFFSMKRES